jgi:hypothetical protein
MDHATDLCACHRLFRAADMLSALHARRPASPVLLLLLSERCATHRTLPFLSQAYSPTSILITGGCGFIASHVVLLLAKKYPDYKASPSLGRGQPTFGCTVAAA